MKAEALLRFDQLYLTEIGLVLFLLMFFGALLWVNRKGSSAIYDRVAALPYEDENINSQHGVKNG